MLRKKAVALAVAGALGTPVAALAQNVQVYGKLYPQLGMFKTSGASSAADLNPALTTGNGKDFKSRINLDASNTRIGFRGSEDLGGGLKAIFQIESKVSIDTGGTLWASRDSFVGLTGGFGTVKLGNMDTVYKSLGDPIGILGISSGNFVSDSAVLSQGPLDGIDFHRREKNSFVYESPSFGGVTLLAGYSIPKEEEAKAAGDNRHPKVESFGVKYEVGPLYIAAAHEIRKDQFAFSSSPQVAGGPFTNPTSSAGGVHSNDTATRAAVMYEFPTKTKVSLDVAQIKLEETGGAVGKFNSAKNNRWAVTGEQGLGNIKLAASYAKSDKGSCELNGGGACTTDGFDGSQLNVGAMLSLSKRTGLFAIYSRLTTGTSASFNNTPVDISPGSDSTQAAIGVTHSF
ncbi:MAG TPA: porin [Burkholderiales bacterium]